jgi:hypothetical protein
VQLLSADSDFGSKAKLSAICEARGRINHHHSRIDLSEETFSILVIIGDY